MCTLTNHFNPHAPACRLSFTTSKCLKHTKMAVAQPSHLAKYLQEEDLTLECRDLISTLPMEKGCII